MECFETKSKFVNQNPTREGWLNM